MAGLDRIELKPIGTVESSLTVLKVHPRDELASPLRGVFTTRSQDRPNSIGLHEVEVLAIEGTRLRVRPLEAVDGTPIVDIKPVLRSV